MQHVALVGDSILDNGAYVAGGPDVATQLRSVLPQAQVTLLAIDGSTTIEALDQLPKLPKNSSHIVISVGGNDALSVAQILEQPVNSVGEALVHLQDTAARFEKSYRAMLVRALSTARPLAICTIYYPRFPDPLQQKACVAALSHFNDVILRLALEYRVPIVDLRLICTDDRDYANPIEPSTFGGAKIAATISAWVRGEAVAGLRL